MEAQQDFKSPRPLYAKSAPVSKRSSPLLLLRSKIDEQLGWLSDSDASGPRGFSDIFPRPIPIKRAGAGFCPWKEQNMLTNLQTACKLQERPVAKDLCPRTATGAQRAGLTQPSVPRKTEPASSPAEIPQQLPEEFHTESYGLRDALGFALAALLTQLTTVRMFGMPSVGMIIPGWEM